MILLLSLILLASFAALVVFSDVTSTSTISVTINLTSTTHERTHTPTIDYIPDPHPSNPVASIDACSIIAQICPKAVKYNHIVDCYNAIPFDNARAATTLATVIAIFRDYYIFTNAALSPTATLPFANAPCDVLGELEKIRQKKFIHVNVDSARRGYEDCIVEIIDGEELSPTSAPTPEIFKDDPLTSTPASTSCSPHRLTTTMAENIHLLIDDRCGSACGMAGYLYTTEHNVESYANGGTSGEDLSMFSFAGASVLRLSKIQDFYSSTDLTSPMSDFPYQSIVIFSWLELYGNGRTISLEYDAQLCRPKHRLDFTSTNAPSNEILWKEVAAASWN